jgi:hypothetical protein
LSFITWLSDTKWSSISLLTAFSYNQATLLSNIFLDNQSFEYAAISIYPNPSKDHKINIDSTISIDDLQLVNINGQLLMEVKNPVFTNNHYTLENIPNGFYFLKLHSNNQSYTKKVLIN